MRTQLQILAMVMGFANLGHTQCQSLPSTSTLKGVTYHVSAPVTSTGMPCGGGDLVIFAHGYVTPGAPP
jgi:hypothetical protein